MITLKVEGYCDSCPDFNPIGEMAFFAPGCTHTIIRCENYARCARIEERIKEQERIKGHEDIV